MNWISMIGFVVGAEIGAGFAWLQSVALHRNEMLLQQNQKPNWWMQQIPGSGGRVAFLLMALVLTQVLFPSLFPGANKWWVTGGLVLAYGCSLFGQLRHRVAQSR